MSAGRFDTANQIEHAVSRPALCEVMIMIKECFQQKRPVISFEVFPPKKEDDFANAFTAVSYTHLDVYKRQGPQGTGRTAQIFLPTPL